MGFLPVSLLMGERTILIIGDNEKSSWKREQLLNYGAKVCCMSASAEFDEKIFEGIQLLFDYSEMENKELWTMARRCGVLVNVHDRASECDFVSPAIYQDGEMSIAVSSNGKDVRASIQLRDKIKHYLEGK